MRSQLTAGAGYGHLTDKFHSELLGSGDLSGRNKGISDLGEIFASWELNTLDNQLNPTSGIDLRSEVLGAAGRYRYRADSDGAAISAGCSCRPPWQTILCLTKLSL